MASERIRRLPERAAGPDERLFTGRPIARFDVAEGGE